MILAIDIGNTNIVLGCVEGKKTFFIERLSTDKAKTELEYAVSLKNVLEIYEIPVDQIEGGIISSVVPQVTELCRSAAEKVIKKPVKVVGPGVKTGLNIKLDDPATAGSDLVVVAVAALNEYTCPQIVIDMGTATTMSVLDQKGCFRRCYSSRITHLSGCTRIKRRAAQPDQSCRAEKSDRQKYPGLPERRHDLRKRRQHRRHDRADGRRTRLQMHHRSHRRPGAGCDSALPTQHHHRRGSALKRPSDYL